MTATHHERLQRSARDHLLLHFARHSRYRHGAAELAVLERGEGPFVFDTAGRRYLDGLSCLFCAQLGYSYGGELGRVAAEQMERLAFNTNWSTAHPPAIDLAERIAELAPEGMGKVFFTSGGSEAVESAYKIARLYHRANGDTQRTTAIARRIAYHGMSLGALSFTGIDALKEPFGETLVPTRHVSNTNAFRASDAADPDAFCRRLLDEVEETIIEAGPETIAMLIAEPVQNAGGSIPPPPGYWRGLRRLADQYGFLLVADEVITGWGRIGEWFAISREGVVPDMVTLAKGITSAHLPLGAVVVADRVAEFLYDEGQSLAHGFTFGGHPVSAAVALRNIELFERDEVLENVRSLTPHLRARMHDLLELPIVGNVRGEGFFWTAELVSDEDDGRFGDEERDQLLRGLLPKGLAERGLIARPDDRGDAVVQIAPPLICDREQLDLLVDGLGDALAEAGALMRAPASEASGAV